MLFAARNLQKVGIGTLWAVFGMGKCDIPKGHFEKPILQAMLNSRDPEQMDFYMLRRLSELNS